MNTNFTDSGQALTDSLDRTGRGVMQANLDFGGYRAINAAAPVEGTDLVTKDSVGSVINPRTQREIDGNVTPIDYSYPERRVPRYVTLTSGATSDITTLRNALSAVGSLEGDGSQSTTVNRTVTGNVINTTNQDDVRISGMTFDLGFSSNSFPGHGIAISGGSRHELRDVVVENFGDNGSGAGTGILIYQGTSRPSVVRMDGCSITAATTPSVTTSVGWILADVDTSFVTNVYVKDVQDGIGYAHELKNDARHNFLSGLIAESSNWALAYGQDTIGIDGSDYNVAQGIIAKSCDGGWISGETTGNIVSNLLHYATSSPGSGTKRTVDLQSSSTQNIVTLAVSFGDVAGPVRFDGDENFVAIADFSSATETIRFQSGAQRNGVHVVHPGARTSIRSRIVDSSGSGVRGTNCNVVYSPITGEWIGSVSGSMLWALGTSNATYLSTNYFRMESDNHAVLAMGTPGNAGDIVGIAYATPTNSQQGAFTYGKQATPTNEYWRVRVNNADVLRIFGAVMRPETDDVYDLGSSSFRFNDCYSTRIRPGSGAPIWTSGAGSPEGTVTATVGSLYTDTSGGGGTTLYVKESGSGSVGWIPK